MPIVAPLAVLEIRRWLGIRGSWVVRSGLGAITLLGDDSASQPSESGLSNEEGRQARHETALWWWFGGRSRSATRGRRASWRRPRAFRRRGSATPPRVISDRAPRPNSQTISPRTSPTFRCAFEYGEGRRRAALAGDRGIGQRDRRCAAAFALTDEEPRCATRRVVRSASALEDGALLRVRQMLELR